MNTLPESFTLAHGSHNSFDDGACLMEAVAWIAGELHSDRPQCADVALAAFGRAFNDRLKDDERQLLRPFIPRLVGTRGTSDLAKRRAYLLVDRHVRINTPAFLRELPNKPRTDLAERFEALDPVVDIATANKARDLARTIRDALWAERPAAYAAYAADADADAAAAAAYAAAAVAASAASAASAAYAAYAADADAAAYAAAAAAYAAAAAAAAAAADAAYAADAWKELRQKSIERSLASFSAAIELTETP